MRGHITTVMRRYAGRVREWDVVNEPLANDGTLAPTVWQRFIGPDHIELALRAARAADPKAKLFINEYGVEGPGRKLEGLVRLVSDLRRAACRSTASGCRRTPTSSASTTRRPWRARCAASPPWACRCR